MQRRLLACLLILGICILPLSSCGDGSGTDTPDKSVTNAPVEGEAETTADSTAETLPAPDLPDIRFDDYEFRILNIDQESMWWAIVNASAESEIGEVVNDAIYKRNVNMEEKYGFKIREIAVAAGALNSNVKKSVNAGGDDYDLICPVSNTIGGLIADGLFVDLNTIPHIDLEKPWWNKSLSYNFSIGNKLYFTMSDLLLTDDENVAILMYNKKMAADLGIDSAEVLYDTVEAGEWTYDKMASLGKAAIKDINGNGKHDGEDSFGLIIVDWASRALVGSSGEAIALKDENDIPYLSCKGERFVEVYDKVRDILAPRDLSARENNDFSGLTEVMFVNDKGLMCIQVLSCVRLYKDMGSDFAVLPLPKFNEVQEKYTSYYLWATGVAVPVTSTNLERTGVILEALTAESRLTVVPAYYEVAMAAKYLRDEKSFRMLDIILENRMSDIALEVYNWGSFTANYNGSLFKADGNFTSLLEKNEGKIQTAMEKTINAYAAAQ